MNTSDSSKNVIEKIDSEEKDIESLINTIITQTDYNRELALEKLTLFNNDYISVIRDYLGTTNKKINNKSLNQQIYYEIRQHLY